MINLQDRLDALCKGNEGFQAQMAREIGISASSISAYRAGKYTAKNKANIEKKLNDYLAKLEAREAADTERQEIGFIETVNANKLFELADSCRIGQRIAIITGDAGLGKTTAVREYAARHSDVVAIYCHQTMTVKGLFQKICQALKLDDRGRAELLFERCAARLGEMRGLLIIDEAEHLSLKALDEVRRLNDSEYGGSGVLLTGLPRFFEMVKSRRHDYAYLSDRIRQHHSMRPLQPAEVRKFVAAALPSAGDLWREFAKIEDNPRRLCALIENTRYLARLNNIEVGIEAICDAADMQI